MKALTIILLLTLTGCTNALLFGDIPEPAGVGSCCPSEPVYYGWASISETRHCGTALESCMTISGITDQYAQPPRLSNQQELMARLSRDFHLTTADINAVVLTVYTTGLPDSLTQNANSSVYISFKRSFNRTSQCSATNEKITVVTIFD